MKVLATESSVIRPSAWLKSMGADPIEILGANCTFAAGSLPHCGVQIPLESANKISQKNADQDGGPLYQLVVGTSPSASDVLFSGYLSGEKGKVSKVGGVLSTGVDLIHPARDLDETRMFAPEVHCGGIQDYTYTFHNQSVAGGPIGSKISQNSYYSGKGGSLAKQIIEAVSFVLEEVVKVSQDANGSAVLGSVEKSQNLLKGLLFSEASLRPTISAKLTQSINDFLRAQMSASFMSMRSCWDILVSIFANFGMFLNCMGDGKITIEADVAGFESPEGNYLGPEYITDFELSSRIQRNVRQVTLVTDNILPADIASGLSGSAQKPACLASYPLNPTEPGGIVCYGLPRWLAPFNQHQSADGVVTVNEVLALQRAFAQSVYYKERNKFRTMLVSGPLAPLVSVGTVAMVSPYPNIKALSGQGADFANKTYIGYCYQINHMIDRAGGTWITSFIFRNVSDGASGETITSDPVLDGVKARTWQ